MTKHIGQPFRDPNITANLKADGMEFIHKMILEKSLIKKERRKREAELNERIFEPIGKLMDNAAREALEELKQIEMKQWSMQNSESGSTSLGSATIRPFLISTNPGMNQVAFPLDDNWTFVDGAAYADGNQFTGELNVSVSADSDNEVSSGNAAILLWIVPQDASKVILVLPKISGNYSWVTQTALGPTAHSEGYLNFYSKVYDGHGAVIDALTTNMQEQLWSGGSSGVSDTANGRDTILREPYIVLRGGVAYEFWCWIECENDAGSNIFGGWSQSLSHFSAKVESIQVGQF